MDDAELRSSQEEQCRAQLLRKLPRQVQRYPPEIRVTKQVIQVVGQHLEHQTEVVPKHEVPL